MDQKILFEINKFKKRNQKLPVSVFFTDRKRVEDFSVVIKSLPRNSAIIIREYDLEKNDRENFAKEIIKIAKLEGFICLIGKDIDLAKKLKADGVHFSDFDKLSAKILNRSGFNKKFIFSFACHDENSIKKAQKLKADMIFISPIFPTLSHLNTKNIGLKNLSKISLKTKNNIYGKNRFSPAIYALGGINQSNISAIRKFNLSGFAAISLFLNK